MKKFIACLIALLLSICFVGCEKDDLSYDQNTTTSLKDNIINNVSIDYPCFLSVENDFRLIADCNLSNTGLQLDARESFVIIAFDRYVIRYNIELNKIDKIIDLGPFDNYHSHNITSSSDGRYIISSVLNLGSDDIANTDENYCLIDFELQKISQLADCFSETNSKAAEEKIPDEVRKEYYNLSFSIDELKSDKISDSKYVSSIYDRFNNSNIWTSSIDLDTLVVVCPADTQHHEFLKNYIILIVDLENDCPIKKFALQ